MLLIKSTIHLQYFIW